MAFKKFDKNETNSKQVKTLSSFGLTQKEIGAVIGCSEDTLQRHFKDEMAAGKPQAVANVAQTLYKLAIGGNVAACIFWLKAQGKWKENVEEKVVNNINIDNAHKKLSNLLNDEE